MERKNVKTVFVVNKHSWTSGEVINTVFMILSLFWTEKVRIRINIEWLYMIWLYFLK